MNDGGCRLQFAVRVILLPEPFGRDRDAGESREVTLLRYFLAGILLKGFNV